MYGGSGGAIVFGLTPSQWSVIGVIVGICVAIAGLVINTWFGWRRDRRERGLQ